MPNPYRDELQRFASKDEINTQISTLIAEGTAESLHRALDLRTSLAEQEAATAKAQLTHTKDLNAFMTADGKVTRWDTTAREAAAKKLRSAANNAQTAEELNELVNTINRSENRGWYTDSLRKIMAHPAADRTLKHRIAKQLGSETADKELGDPEIAKVVFDNEGRYYGKASAYFRMTPEDRTNAIHADKAWVVNEFRNFGYNPDHKAAAEAYIKETTRPARPDYERYGRAFVYGKEETQKYVRSELLAQDGSDKAYTEAMDRGLINAVAKNVNPKAERLAAAAEKIETFDEADTFYGNISKNTNVTGDLKTGLTNAAPTALPGAASAEETHAAENMEAIAWPKRERGVMHFYSEKDRERAPWLQAKVDAHTENYGKIQAAIARADARRAGGNKVNEKRVTDLQYRLRKADNYREYEGRRQALIAAS